MLGMCIIQDSEKRMVTTRCRAFSCKKCRAFSCKGNNREELYKAAHTGFYLRLPSFVLLTGRTTGHFEQQCNTNLEGLHAADRDLKERNGAKLPGQT